MLISELSQLLHRVGAHSSEQSFEANISLANTWKKSSWYHLSPSFADKNLPKAHLSVDRLIQLVIAFTVVVLCRRSFPPSPGMRGKLPNSFFCIQNALFVCKTRSPWLFIFLVLKTMYSNDLQSPNSIHFHRSHHTCNNRNKKFAFPGLGHMPWPPTS